MDLRYLHNINICCVCLHFTDNFPKALLRQNLLLLLFAQSAKHQLIGFVQQVL